MSTSPQDVALLSSLSTFLTLLGAFTSLFYLLRVLRFTLFHLRPPSLTRYTHPSGAWALVTGASDGIGLRFAEQLASHGFNVVLHGRNPAKLAGVQKALEAQFPACSFRTAVADAVASAGMNDRVARLARELSELPGPLTVVVHNVGGTVMQSHRLISVAQASPADIDGCFDGNVRFAVQLTRELLPLLDKSAPRLMAYVSSFAGLCGTGYVAPYSGCKAFLMAWAESLARELQMQKRDIEVMCWIVGRTCDASYYKGEKPTLFTPDATAVARASLAKAGSGRIVVVPHWGHGVQAALLKALSEWVQTLLLKSEAQKELDFFEKLS